MTSGLVFDIKEFALNDGPGIRLTVFLKGCPLRCLWCHNPEGLSAEPQINQLTGKLCGHYYTPQEIVTRALKFKDLFEMSGGGVTFSGGEATSQFDFLYETAIMLSGIHKNLDTSGYCPQERFLKLLDVFDLFFFDLKLGNEQQHKKYTGVSNALILKNLQALDFSGKSYHVRIPLIPDITDTVENLSALSDIILRLKNPLKIDLLPYNILAGAKYSSYGLKFSLPDKKEINLSHVNEFRKKLKNYNVELY